MIFSSFFYHIFASLEIKAYTFIETIYIFTSYHMVYKTDEFAVSQPHAPMSCKSVAEIVRETFNMLPSITSTLPTV